MAEEPKEMITAILCLLSIIAVLDLLILFYLSVLLREIQNRAGKGISDTIKDIKGSEVSKILDYVAPIDESEKVANKIIEDLNK
jgi:hypothetical protein